MALRDLLVVVLDVIRIECLEITAQRQEETNSMSGDGGATFVLMGSYILSGWK